MPNRQPDELDEPVLPPLDADEGDTGEDDSDVSDIENLHLDEMGEDGLDDENAADLDVGPDLDPEDEPSHAIDPIVGPDVDPIDVGDLDEGLVGGLDDRSTSGADEDGLAGEDASLGIDPDEEHSDLVDGGAEGTDEAPEDAIDATNYPDLDADDEGDLDEDDLLDVVGPPADEHDMPPWADVRWASPVGAGASIPSTSVSVLGSRVAAAGRVLLTIDEGAHAARQLGPVPDVRAIQVLSGGGIAVASSLGISVIDIDHPESPTRLFEPAPKSVSLAFATSKLWARCDRALWAIPMPPSPPVSTRREGVRAIAGAGRALVVLEVSGDDVALIRLGGDDEIAARAVLTGEAARIAKSDDVGLAAAAAGEAIAIWGSDKLVVRRTDKLATVFLPPVVAATFAGDERTAPLLALVRYGDDLSLIMVPHDGVMTRLADLGANDAVSSAGVAVAWDTARELLWVACDRGLLAFGPTQDH